MKLLGWLLLLAALGGGAYGYFANREIPPVPVQTHILAKDTLRVTLEAKGTIVNDRTVKITALLNGELRTLLARIGRQVKAGEVLAELDSRETQALLQKAQAQIAHQKNAVQSAQLTFSRQKELMDRSSTSRQNFDDARMALAMARSQLAIAEADAKLSQIRMENAQIKAPFDGVVVEKPAEVGQWVEAGTHLFTIVAREGRVIEAQLDASDIGRVHIGQVATLTSDAYQDKQWQGKVKWIAPTMDLQSKQNNQFAVHVSLEAAAPILLLGQQVSVSIEVQTVDDALLLPLDALLQNTQPDQAEVFVVSEALQAQKRTVELGASNAQMTVVNTGLSAGERVVRQANAMGLWDGARVAP